MTSAQYRIEGIENLMGRLIPSPNFSRLYKSQSLAVAVAIKSLADPTSQEIRVVHVPSGEIVFQTTAQTQFN
jgi:hypothetical protein